MASVAEPLLWFIQLFHRRQLIRSEPSAEFKFTQEWEVGTRNYIIVSSQRAEKTSSLVINNLASSMSVI